MRKNNAMQAQEKVSRKLRTKQDSGETLLAFFSSSSCLLVLFSFSTSRPSPPFLLPSSSLSLRLVWSFRCGN
ncbi:hypothetical protein M440DRAFT_133065 [Trichoderma longibrachiatum ATCC 18648]|uniref:Uncharacterized protein n=1 Tax=Trichoderma longibrachiatum ATCC 18648 TaxID=983965 RepID=A0A2T4BW89_TRILO|nr:hypothetical protein M440DRAFT_133065 [Trichoderma longibrachiatum ATCC 18648]